ncbi:aldehyde dehydrogenase family protein [Citricoccus sp. NPDC055426]|uniref:aldehyde dehydrogenase family protein n=1 Tax=Citricoccus sp. NPDC055426 TaxID=3155536 RepID=UPI003418B7AF
MTSETISTPRTLFTNLTINGASVPGEGEVIRVVNPATGEPIGEVAGATEAQTESAIAAAREAFDDGRWSGLPPATRATAIGKLADLLEQSDALLDVLVSEVGTPISTARMIQIGQPVATLRYYSELAGSDFSEALDPAPLLDGISIVDHVPVGVVAAISAYNFPLTLAMWKLGPALAAGCSVVLVSSPKTPLATLEFGRLIAEAGIPDGVINVLAGGAEVSTLLTTHPSIDKVGFTGSATVGRLVMGQAATSLKDVVLELGGKSPAIILPGTHLEDVVAPLIQRTSRNTGQACAAPTRYLVHENDFAEFERLAKESVAEITIGDPFDEDTLVGPLIRDEHRANVAGMVDRAIASGGRLLAQGDLPEGGVGYFFPVTILADLAQDAEIVQEEVFGPVAVVSSYRTVDEAVELANDSQYGLQGYVFGADVVEATAVGRRLRVGTVVINGGGGGARVDAPFGGFKQSGVGRELGRWGLEAYFEPRHVQIATRAPRKAN